MAAALADLAGGDAAVLAELRAALTPAQLRGETALPVTLPRTGPLGRHYRALIAALPPRTRTALLLAAATEEATAAAAATTAAAALVPAELAGIVQVSTAGRVTFTPPVLRALIYHEAPAAVRRAVHARLATTTGDPLHRAAAAAGPDDALATELFSYGKNLPPARAATALDQAARLTTDPELAERARLGAARSAWLAGQAHRARTLLRATTRQQALAWPDGGFDELLSAAGELAGSDPGRALDAVLAAAQHAGDQRRFADTARYVLSASAPAGDDPRRALARGLAELSGGAQRAGFEQLRAAREQAAGTTDPATLIHVAAAQILIGADRAARQLAEDAAERARLRSEPALVPQALQVAATASLALGDHPAAAAAARQGAALAAATGQSNRVHLGILAVVAALAGDRPATTARAREAGTTGGLVAWALALLDLIEGRPAACADRLARLHDHAVLRIAAAPHLVEAAWRAGAPGPEPPVAFERWTVATGEPSWLALLARCRALLAADPREAGELFREALRQHGENDYARAHTELLYGRHLRRHRQPAAAREHLRLAAETFTALGAGPWAAQAGVELRAAGAAPVRSPQPGRLTAQQEQIARLVAAGATNREIAQELFLSPRTVDHHLRNVYERLGVRSRTELARLF
ncbi:response regulator receiver protein [Actinoplanes sp. N902-109]|nr:response regulator receiver protein [Actinoplanes sp. N902-109]